MADGVANHRARAGQIAAARHGDFLFLRAAGGPFINEDGPARDARPRPDAPD
jgi:hypothetical protein